MKNTTPPLVRLVDDDLTVAASLTFVLEVAGLQVRHYESARRFLAYDDPEREGCLLLDVRMPEMTGLELQTELNARASDLPGKGRQGSHAPPDDRTLSLSANQIAAISWGVRAPSFRHAEARWNFTVRSAMSKRKAASLLRQPSAMS